MIPGSCLRIVALHSKDNGVLKVVLLRECLAMSSLLVKYMPRLSSNTQSGRSLNFKVFSLIIRKRIMDTYKHIHWYFWKKESKIKGNN